MRLTISEEVRGRFPRLVLGTVSAAGIDNTRTDADLGRDLDEAIRAFRERFEDEEALVAHPLLEAWRAAYTQFGINPKRQRPSAEAVLRRFAKGSAVPRINTVVDLYLLSELKYLLPVGGYDTSRIVGDLSLRASPGGEDFTPIGGTKPEPTKEGEVVYADDAGVLTRCWNWRDADRAKITEETTRIVLCVELPLEVEGGATALRSQIEQIGADLERYCGAHVTVRVFTGDELVSVELPAPQG